MSVLLDLVKQVKPAEIEFVEEDCSFVESRFLNREHVDILYFVVLSEF